jgi:uncharacterized protein YjbI with pentapeptide repeats
MITAKRKAARYLITAKRKAARYLITAKRKAALQEAAQANLRAGKPPYWRVTLRTRQELEWIASSLKEAHHKVDLRGVDLTGIVLCDIDLRGANLTNADLTHANLSGASLTGALLIDTVAILKEWLVDNA